MSALNKGYEINETDLYYLVRQMQDKNPPTSRYQDKELRHLANEALRNAITNVGDQPAYKMKAERDAYWAQEWDRISRELRGEE